jgi:hypothetical protein
LRASTARKNVSDDSHRLRSLPVQEQRIVSWLFMTQYARVRACVLGYYFGKLQNQAMAGRKNRGMLRTIAANAASKDSAAFEAIDKLIEEMMDFRLPGEVPAQVSVIQNSKVTGREWRLPRAERPRCGARTRTGSPCKRPGLRNGRCPNHGGLSSGPKTKAGKRRIAFAQKQRWKAYRERKNRLA